MFFFLFNNIDNLLLLGPSVHYWIVGKIRSVILCNKFKHTFLRYNNVRLGKDKKQLLSLPRPLLLRFFSHDITFKSHNFYLN